MKNAKKTYREQEKQKAVNLINNSQIFNGDTGKKPYFLKGAWHPKADLLMDWKNNLYAHLKEEVLLYFALNKIAFHHSSGELEEGFCVPSGHALSSQISCINHLYPLRYDKKAVLEIARTICPDFTDVLEITTDSFLPGYIAFEVVSDIDHLNEKANSRGTMCTSIDALIYAQHENGKKYLLPIEWKYTECYFEDADKEGYVEYEGKYFKDYSIEDRYKEKEGKGKERLRRYCESGLIDKSAQLKSLPLNEYKNSVYFFEPFYQLMRQTLWAEQMIAYKDTETIKADDFIHIHVVPEENTELLSQKYPCSQQDMKTTWENCLSDQEKYQIITPKELLKLLTKNVIYRNKYADLASYLSTRYWN